MKIRVARGQCQLHRQFVIIKFNQFGRITGLLHRFGNDHCNGFTNVTHPICCQQGARWFGPITAITVFYNRTFQVHQDPSGNQISRRNNSCDTVTIACITDVQICNNAVRDWRAENKRMKCICRCDIIDVFTKACQKPLIFNACYRLAFPELIHVASILLLSRSFVRTLLLELGLSNPFPPFI